MNKVRYTVESDRVEIRLPYLDTDLIVKEFNADYDNYFIKDNENGFKLYCGTDMFKAFKCCDDLNKKNVTMENKIIKSKGHYLGIDGRLVEVSIEVVNITHLPQEEINRILSETEKDLIKQSDKYALLDPLDLSVYMYKEIEDE